MGNKYGYYIIPKPLDEVWNRTLFFWENNHGNVKFEQYSKNGLFRSMIVKHNITAFSWGETYKMNFGFNPNDSMTYVSVEISLEFGYGLQWLKPQNLMKKWASKFGLPPLKLIRTIDNNFFNILTEIQYFNTKQPLNNLSKKYCPECGRENNQTNNYCIECGNNLKD
ncbi:MAG: hypothetical protein ACFFBP_07320 [Promethearchaeota archaeon]